MHPSVLNKSFAVSLVVHAGLLGLLLLAAKPPVPVDKPIRVRIVEPPPLPVAPSIPAPAPQPVPRPTPRAAPPRQAVPLPQKAAPPTTGAPTPRAEAPPPVRGGSSERNTVGESLGLPGTARVAPAPAPAPVPVMPVPPSPSPQVAARPAPEAVPAPPEPRHEAQADTMPERGGLSLGGPLRSTPAPPTASPPARSARPSIRDQIAGFGSGLLADAGGPAKQTINLDDRRPRFLSYLARLKHQIQSEWVYPDEARRVGMGGELVLVFTLNPAGTLIHIQLVESSGFPILDDEALRAVKNAAPFDPFPPQMGEEPWNISAIFRYQSPYLYRRN